MPILDRFFRLFSADGPAQATTVDGTIAVNHATEAAWPSRSLVSDAQAYQRNALVYACIRERATSAIEAPLRILDAEGNVITEGALAELIQEPCPGYTMVEWMQDFWTFHDLSGNVYVHHERNRGGKTVALTLLRPDRIEIVAHPSGRPAGYRYTVDEHQYYIPTEDISHFKTPNPLNDWYGIGPVGVLAKMINIDNSATDYIKAWIDNSGVPAGYLSVKRKLHTQAEADEIRRSWKTKLGGLNRGNVAVLDADATYTPAAPIQAPEMPDVRNFVESRICGVFGIDPRIVSANVGIQASSGTADYSTARKSFWEETLMPMYVLIEAFLSRVFRDEHPKLEPRFDFSKVRALQPSQREIASQARRDWLAGGISLDEYRRVIGYPEWEAGGELRLVPRSMVEVGPDAQLPEPAPADMNSVTQGLAERAQALAQKLKNIATEQADAAEPRIEKALTRIARRADGILGRAIGDEQQQSLPRGGDLVPSDADEEMAEAIRAASRASAEQGWAAINSSALVAVEEIDDQVVQQVVANGAGRVVGINQTTRTAINEAIDTGLAGGLTRREISDGVPSEADYRRGLKERGLSDDEITDRMTARRNRGVPANGHRGLRSIVAQTYKGRARAIARTEMTTALNMSSAARYRRSGVTHVRILDGVEDEGCEKANGKIVTIEWFEENPTEHPNCQRTASPIVPGLNDEDL